MVVILLVMSLVVGYRGYAAHGVIWDMFPLSILRTDLCKFDINSFLNVWKNLLLKPRRPRGLSVGRF